MSMCGLWLVPDSYLKLLIGSGPHELERNEAVGKMNECIDVGDQHFAINLVFPTPKSFDAKIMLLRCSFTLSLSIKLLLLHGG